MKSAAQIAATQAFKNSGSLYLRMQYLFLLSGPCISRHFGQNSICVAFCSTLFVAHPGHL